MDNIELDTVDKCIPVVNDIITTYCIDNNINENDILPNIWKDILLEIYYQVFKDNRVLLRLPGTIYNEYNIRVIEDIYIRIYKRICLKHNKAIYLLDFSEMVGISREVMYEWLNTSRSDIAQQIKADNERSLEGLLQDKAYNPMKILPSLNHWHNWNEGSGHVTIEHKKAQSIQALPSFGGAPGLPGAPGVDNEL